MNIWIVIAIIVFALGFIAAGILLLQQTSNTKMPKVTKDNNASYDRFDDEED